MVRTFDHGDGWKQGLRHLWSVNYFTKTIHHHHHRHHHLEDLSSNAANYVKGNNPSRQWLKFDKKLEKIRSCPDNLFNFFDQNKMNENAKK